MRSVKHSLALASLALLVASASCTLITDVDRSKIPSMDASVPTPGEAGAGMSSNAGSGNVENTAGAGDTGGAAGTPGGLGDAAGAPTGGEPDAAGAAGAAGAH